MTEIQTGTTRPPPLLPSCINHNAIRRCTIHPADRAVKQMNTNLQTFELRYVFHYTIKHKKGTFVEQVAKLSTSICFGVRSK